MKLQSFLSKWQYRCLLYILILPLFAMFISCATIEKQLFPTPPPTPPAGNCQLSSNGETLDALWLEGKEGMPVFLFIHGNYQRITDIKLFCKNQMNCNKRDSCHETTYTRLKARKECMR